MMTTETKPRKLNARQWLFAQEYVKSTNGTLAAIAAGYSERTAKVQASRLLTKANVQEAIAEAREIAANLRKLTPERVLEEYRRLAFAQTTDMVELKGGWIQIRSTDELTVEQKSAISQIKQKADGSIEVKFYDKTKALEALGKYFALFTDRVEIEQVGPPPVIQLTPAPAPQIVEGEARALPEGEA